MKATAILETNDSGISGSNGTSSGATNNGLPNDDKFDDKAASFKKRIVNIVHELPNLLDE